MADVALEPLAEVPQHVGPGIAVPGERAGSPPEIHRLNEHADDGLVVGGRVGLQTPAAAPPLPP